MDFKALKPLPDDLNPDFVEPMCFCAKLAKINPTGTGNRYKWSYTGSILLQELIQEHKVLYFIKEVSLDFEHKTRFSILIIKGFETKSDGDPDEMYKDLVSLYYKEHVTEGPFEPTYEKVVDIAELLIEKGLGLPGRIKFPRIRRADTADTVIMADLLSSDDDSGHINTDVNGNEASDGNNEDVANLADVGDE